MKQCEIKHAEWKINPDGYYPYCPECYHEPKNGVMSKYCPECGAKMDGKLELNLPEHIRKAVELRHDGCDIKDIAKMLRYCERQIYRFLKKARKDEGK